MMPETPAVINMSLRFICHNIEMRKITICVTRIITFTVLFIHAGHATEQSDQTAVLMQSLANYADAIGGQAAIDNVKSVRAKGTITSADRQQIPYTIEFMPQQQRMRMDYVFQGIPATNAYDGESGWTIPPLLSAAGTQPLENEQLQAVREQADFFGVLVNNRQKNTQLELLETTGVDNHLIAIRAQRSGSNTDKQSETSETWFLDQNSWLPERVDASTTIAKQKRNISIKHSDYRIVGDATVSIRWPFRIESDYGRGNVQVNVIESMEINIELDEKRFFAASADAE